MDGAMEVEAGTVEEYLAALKGSPRFGPQVVHHEEFAVSPARHGELARPLPAVLAEALKRSGVSRLYSHQVAAIDHIRAGRSVIAATPTASGKSLIYNVPVFEALLADPKCRALYLFPLKALAQDQLRAIDQFAAHLPKAMRPRAAICDGDTSSYQRKKLRDEPPQILISNPDMLHLSLLGYHQRWASFWHGLRYVVLDEVHTYRGVFGSHMAWVLRRLIRICHLYGSEPVFLLSSATIGNPGELARDLIDREVAVVCDSGAPRGGRHFLFFDPHESAAAAACQLLEAAVKRQLRTIVYTQSRKMTELISIWTANRLGEEAVRLTSYRSGYRPEERREIEGKLASGELLGVVSTSALELGIDIGSLDICILVGYPGTVMATWQRGGRVGRRQRDSLVILVGHEDALDQYFMRHPQDFFARQVESAVLNPENRQIIRKHLICAAAEHFFAVDDPMLAGKAVQRVVAELAASGELLLDGPGRHWFTNRKYPHRQVDLRGSGRGYQIREAQSGELLGEVDGMRCFKECHEGAVYLHRGRTWLITELDIENRQVAAVERSLHYFTKPLSSKETEILEVHGRRRFRNFAVSFGTLRVTETVTAYQKRHARGQQWLATVPLDLPPHVFETEGLWLEIPPATQQLIEREMLHFMGGIHAVEHGAIGIFPLLVLCDRNDVGGIAYPFHPEVKGPAVFIYDGYPGGVGLAEQAFHKVEELLKLTLETIRSCPCEVGCPSCVHSPKCGSGNRPIDKGSARRILEALLSGGLEQVEEAVVERPRPRPPAGEQPGGVVAVAKLAPKASAPASATAARQGKPLRYGVFDVETKFSASEVGGWHRAEKMGVSVAVLYDSLSDSYNTFLEEEIPELVERLRRFDLVVGFNNKRFDNQVLSAYTDVDLHSLPTLDLLEAVRNRLGYRLSLNHLAEHTLGIKKSGDGLQALQWYKEGRIDKIAEYCRKDVEITRGLYLFGCENSYLLFRNKGGQQVRCPIDFGACAAGRTMV